MTDAEKYLKWYILLNLYNELVLELGKVQIITMNDTFYYY